MAGTAWPLGAALELLNCKRKAEKAARALFLFLQFQKRSRSGRADLDSFQYHVHDIAAHAGLLSDSVTLRLSMQLLAV